MEIDPPLPTFHSIDQVLSEVRENGKPTNIILLGTIWSPPCRYTWQALSIVMKDPKIQETTQAYFVNQDAAHDFCYAENIPIGFPTTLIFSTPNPNLPDSQEESVCILRFYPKGQMQDQNKPDLGSNRLLRQLNPEQFRSIIEEAQLVYEGKQMNLTLPE